MKKFFIVILFSVAVIPFIGVANAQSEEIYQHTVREEAEGKELWGKLQEKQISCGDLNDENFGALGEYFMGQMMEDSHVAMNTMMTNMMGEKGEEAMHIVMGKRLSGCDTAAAFPAEGMGFMPMMMGMMGNWSLDNTRDKSSPVGFNSMMNMMNFGYGFGFFGWIFMVLWWILIIAGIVALVRWLSGQSRGGSKSALDILKERYAKGEISKQEFEEKSREIKNS